MYFIKGFAFLATILSIGFFAWRSLVDPKLHRWTDLRFAVAIPLAAVGYLAPNIWVYYASVTGAMIFLPRSRIEAACFFIVISLMLPLVSFEVRAGSMLLMQMTTVHAAALGLIAAFRFPSYPSRIRVASSRYDALAFAMTAILFIIDCRSADTSFTTAIRFAMAHGMTFFLPYYFLTRSPLTEQDPRRLVHCIAMIGFMLAIVAIFESVKHWPLYQIMDRNLDIAGRSKSMNVRAGFLRSPGPFFESTTFGVFLAVATTMVIASRSLFRSKQAYWTSAAICVIGTGATMARNAWLGLIIGMVLITLYRGRSERFFALTLGGLLGMAVLSLVASNSTQVGELVGSEGHAAATTDYREDLFRNSIPLILKKPLIGWSYTDVRAYMRPIMGSGTLSVDYVNSYLFFAVVSGIVGFLIFVIYLFYSPWRIYLLRPKIKGFLWEYEVAAALFASGGAFIIMVGFTSYYERMPLFGVLLISLSRQLELWSKNRLELGRPNRAAVVSTAHEEFVEGMAG